MPIEMGRRLAALIPDCRATFLPDEGHFSAARATLRCGSPHAVPATRDRLQRRRARFTELPSTVYAAVTAAMQLPVDASVSRRGGAPWRRPSFRSRTRPRAD